MKNDPTFWLLARATGLTAYVLLTVSVLAGLTVKAKPFGRALKAATAVDFHRFVALLAIGMVALHGLVLVLDETVEIGLGALLVPGLAPYRPLWTGLGVLAGELMVLVYVSFALKRRIGQKNWRRLHWATYGTFVAATGHGLFAGSDSAEPWALGLYLGAVGAVAAATAWRTVASAGPAARPRPQGQPQQQLNQEGAA
jgi:DMSO/TMAO reductase YedYZ heme-binding membrane subunit